MTKIKNNAPEICNLFRVDNYNVITLYINFKIYICLKIKLSNMVTKIRDKHEIHFRKKYFTTNIAMENTFVPYS